MMSTRERERDPPFGSSFSRVVVQQRRNSRSGSARDEEGEEKEEEQLGKDSRGLRKGIEEKAWRLFANFYLLDVDRSASKWWCGC